MRTLKKFDKQYYYYTKWCYPGDADLEAGFYHTTWETSQDFKTFLANVEPTKEFLIKCFDTREELYAFAKTVKL